ncbi:unnamed protein product [Trypanosoma congolense IL3000]|uniref:WGS project CAEQ00000000 data, annotated contig 423 n=1 Tax=Trypanosoma congolense (strain IL3000) TaxID=1068625 RepID=F9WFU4_TRYCI|nr:unnamed protein product [Trypanosoma congolense IL3000]
MFVRMTCCLSMVIRASIRARGTYGKQIKQKVAAYDGRFHCINASFGQTHCGALHWQQQLDWQLCLWGITKWMGSCEWDGNMTAVRATFVAAAWIFVSLFGGTVSVDEASAREAIGSQRDETPHNAITKGATQRECTPTDRGRCNKWKESADHKGSVLYWNGLDFLIG